MTNVPINMEGAFTAHCTASGPRKSLRGSIRLLISSCIFGQIWNSVAGGLALTHLGKILGMTPFGFGLLNGLIPYGQFAQLLGSFLVERYGHRKWIFIISGLIHRGLWVPIAFLPLFGASTVTWTMLIILATLSYLAAYTTVPASTSWISALIPGRLQGRYFARRSQVGLIASLVIMFLVGGILDKAQLAGPAALKQVLVLFFIGAGLMGMIEHIMHIPVPDPPTHTPKPKVSLWAIIGRPLADREFICFLGFYCTLNCSSYFTGQFMTLFLLDVLNWSNLQFSILNGVVMTLISIFVNPFWGRIVDRTGYKPVFVIGGLSYVAIALWPILASPNQWVVPYIFCLAVLAFAPALDAGAAVFMYTKVSGQGERGLGSAFPAVYGIGIALGGTLSAIFAGIIAQWIGASWRGSFLGYPLTYHSIIFILAFGLRLAGLAWMLGFKNLKGYSIRRTLQVLRQQATTDILRFAFWPGLIFKRQEKLS